MSTERIIKGRDALSKMEASKRLNGMVGNALTEVSTSIINILGKDEGADSQLESNTRGKLMVFDNSGNPVFLYADYEREKHENERMHAARYTLVAISPHVSEKGRQEYRGEKIILREGEYPESKPLRGIRRVNGGFSFRENYETILGITEQQAIHWAEVVDVYRNIDPDVARDYGPSFSDHVNSWLILNVDEIITPVKVDDDIGKIQELIEPKSAEELRKEEDVKLNTLDAGLRLMILERMNETLALRSGN